MILGLTGSFGSGKSTVASMLQSFGGAHGIDTDQITHELQKPGKQGFTEIVSSFGSDIIGVDGGLNRGKLADIVFNDDAQLQTLNGIIHPLVWEEVARVMAQIKNHPLVLLIVPLLFETGTDAMCDKVLVVSVSEEQRLRRLKIRNGLTPKEVQKRLAAQMPQKEKEDRADFVIDNSGPLAETQAQVLALLEQWGLLTKQPH